MLEKSPSSAICETVDGYVETVRICMQYVEKNVKGNWKKEWFSIYDEQTFNNTAEKKTKKKKKASKCGITNDPLQGS